MSTKHEPVEATQETESTEDSAVIARPQSDDERFAWLAGRIMQAHYRTFRRLAE
jgi:hypothetical protein